MVRSSVVLNVCDPPCVCVVKLSMEPNELGVPSHFDMQRCRLELLKVPVGVRRQVPIAMDTLRPLRDDVGEHSQDSEGAGDVRDEQGRTLIRANLICNGDIVDEMYGPSI